ncbi:zinc ribbon domain-containing protein [Alloscardovia omnicolens]
MSWTGSIQAAKSAQTVGWRKPNSLSERTYHCDYCGISMDRDLNAAININVAGSAPETLNARGGSVRLVGNMSLADPVKREPSQHDYAVRLGADNRKTVL